MVSRFDKNILDMVDSMIPSSLDRDNILHIDSNSAKIAKSKYNIDTNNMDTHVDIDEEMIKKSNIRDIMKATKRIENIERIEDYNVPAVMKTKNKRRFSVKNYTEKSLGLVQSTKKRLYETKYVDQYYNQLHQYMDDNHPQNDDTKRNIKMKGKADEEDTNHMDDIQYDGNNNIIYDDKYVDDIVESINVNNKQNIHDRIQDIRNNHMSQQYARQKDNKHSNDMFNYRNSNIVNRFIDDRINKGDTISKFIHTSSVGSMSSMKNKDKLKGKISEIKDMIMKKNMLKDASLLSKKIQNNKSDNNLIEKMVKTAKNIYYNNQSVLNIRNVKNNKFEYLPFANEMITKMNHSERLVLDQAEKTRIKLDNNNKDTKIKYKDQRPATRVNNYIKNNIMMNTLTSTTSTPLSNRLFTNTYRSHRSVPFNMYHPHSYRTVNDHTDQYGDRHEYGSKLNEFIHDIDQLHKFNKVVDRDYFEYAKHYKERNFIKDIDYEDIFRDHLTQIEDKQIMEKAHKIYLMCNPAMRKNILRKSSRTLKHNAGTLTMNRSKQVDYIY